MANTDFDVILNDEIIIKGLELDVMGSGDLPILDNPALASDVRIGKQFINQNGNKVNGSGETYEVEITPEEEPIIINADRTKLGIDKVKVNAIPDKYLVPEIEGEVLIMSKATINGEVLEL